MLLAGTATALSTLGRLQCNEIALRVLLLASGHVWSSHDLLVGSLPGFVADVSCIVTGAWILLLNLRAVGASEWKPAPLPAKIDKNGRSR